MDRTCWHMNATLGGANLDPGVNLHTGANLHPGANCAYEHGFRFSKGKLKTMIFFQKLLQPVT